MRGQQLVKDKVTEHSVSTMSTYSFSIESMIQGYHVYKDIWSDPDDEAVLECKCKPGNSSDPYAVAVLKEITGADTVVGHVPRAISSICTTFLRRSGSTYN